MAGVITLDVAGEVEYPPEPRRDGSSYRGWRVVAGDADREPQDDWRRVLAASPRWAEYGR